MNNLFVLILIIVCIVLFILEYINNPNSSNTIENTDIPNSNITTELTSELKSESESNTQIKDEYANKLDKSKNDFLNKINPEILDNLGIDMEDIKNFVSSTISLNNLNKTQETFEMIETFLNEKQSKYDMPNHISFKSIVPNKLYYGLPCDYIKNDCFYDSLKSNNFVITQDILKACLVVPCSYETTEKELVSLDKNKISLNKYGDGVRIFMLNNTDHMVSKLSLWKYLKQKYGSDIASTMLPYTWDLTDPNDINIFKSQYDKNKLYITKNNYQRQEGIEIHSSLDSIINSGGKYLLVQELLQNPYLISGRKINLRVYVLVIRDNYSNIKLNIYRDGFMYYTPELFEPANPSFKKNITTGYIDRQVYVDNPLTHMDFRKWLDNSSRPLTPIEKYIKQTHPNIKLSSYVFSQIYEQLGFIFKTYEEVVGTKTRGVSFQLYGVDVAINEDLNPLVMEINKGPDLTAKDGRDKNLKLNLCTDILKSVGLIENINNNFITVLEKVNIDGNKIFINNLVEN
jgi:hypothetical protein